MWHPNTLRGSDRRGFTLVELMIVVTIIGVLSSLAIYGVGRYLKHAKTAEASRILGALEKGEQAKFQVDTDPSGTGAGIYYHQFCPTTATVPTVIASITGKKYTSAISEWTTSGWMCLRFSINEPQFYMYSTITSGSGTAAVYQITGQGDLDGNGVPSLYRINGIGAPNGDTARTSWAVANADE